jgi:hypothetical protein
MAVLRFPSNVNSDTRPYVLFSTNRPNYDRNASAVVSPPTGDSVALYLPTNYNVSDLFRYETAATGAIGAVFELASEKGTSVTGQDVKDVLEGVAYDNAGGIAAAGAAAVGSRLGPGGAVLGALVTASAAGNVVSEFSKSYQKTLNPREFMLFKAPGIRQFGFNFTFIPSDEDEVKSIPKIIKFFRLAAYPEGVGAADIQYQFPDAFTVQFKNSDQMIKMPGVVCIGTNITYNPNSMSYYTIDNLPVEINLQLSFQELQPISRALVMQGF